jgi:pimeloyl-ACP methyl ester carboxylesterase
MESTNHSRPVHYRTAEVGGIDVFYREAGPDSGPVVLLLHGFPSSSRMFRDLIPRLSDAYRVIAPDYPAFGHSAVPDRSAFGYTFDHLADVVDGLLEQLGIDQFAIYVMDFGAAVGFRLALRHPERLSAIIVQNAPLYPWAPQGWWATLGQYWADGSAEHRHAARSYLELEELRGQYLSGVQDPSRIDPDNWVIDKALIDRPGVDEIMLDLLYDIPNQAPMFRAMQEFLRDRRPPTLVATGGQRRDLPRTGRPADPHRPPGRRVPRAPDRPLRTRRQGSRDRCADAGLPGTDTGRPRSLTTTEKGERDAARNDTGRGRRPLHGGLLD